METKQHTQLPNEMATHNLKPVDQLIYVIIKSHDGKEGCFPSLALISEESKVSIPTIKKSINRLKDAGYIKVERIGKRNYYTFNEYKKFEPFSKEFIKNTDLTPTTKAYLIAAQQYMYKDIENYGKISYSNCKLAEKLNMSESSVRKCNQELVRKNFLEVVKNTSRDLETGCCTETKVFALAKLGQAIVWKLKEHELQIEQNTEDIKQLKKTIEEQQKLIERLYKEREKPQYTYTL